MYIDVPYTVDIRKGIMPTEMKQPLYFAEEYAHRIIVSLVDGTEIIDLEEGVQCNVHIILKNTNQTIVGIPGTIETDESGNRSKCVVVLPPEAYAVQGPINVVINIAEEIDTDDQGEPVYSVTTILSLNCVVRSTLTGTEIVIHGTTIPSLDDLAARIQELESTTEEMEENVDTIMNDLVNIVSSRAIRYDSEQALSSTIQKVQARINSNAEKAVAREILPTEEGWIHLDNLSADSEGRPELYKGSSYNNYKPLTYLAQCQPGDKFTFSGQRVGTKVNGYGFLQVYEDENSNSGYSVRSITGGTISRVNNWVVTAPNDANWVYFTRAIIGNASANTFVIGIPAEVRFSQIENEIASISLDSDIFTTDAKMALLACFSKVAWTDEHGQDYYDALESALFPSVNVTGISCSYTQSETVLDTDSLDSLRTDLTVTATLSNGLTQNVQNYTLVGTLASGSSTITVIYGNYTDSFNVDVLGIPYGYTRYDYIQNTTMDSSGGHQENYSINTGLSSKYCDTRYIHELTFWITSSPASSSNTSGFFGARPNTGSAGSAAGVNMWFNKSVENKIGVGYNGVDSGNSVSCTWGTVHVIRLDSGNIMIDNVVAKTQSASRETFDTANIWIFGVGSPVSVPGAKSTALSLVRIYSYKLIDGQTNEIIADMVPCTNPDSVAGMYDKIRHAFFYAPVYANFSCGNEEV